jgi:hypothetical protein
MATDYVVVAGTVAGLAAFQTGVETYLGQGYTLSGGPQVSGGDIYQGVVKESNLMVSSFAITDATIGVAGAGIFKFTSDQRTLFPIGFKFTIVGSTGNDGIWTVKSTGATYAGGKTVIPVVEAVTDATVDGRIFATS